jgi:hypothetical protein
VAELRAPGQFESRVFPFAAQSDVERDPVSTSSATFPRSFSSRSVRATAEWQYSQMTTIDCPLLNSTGPPHEGQFATSALI